MAKLQKACRNYNAWKAEHTPELKPWLFPEQNTLPRLNPADIGKWELTALPVVDEADAVLVLSDGGEEDDESSPVVMRTAAAAAASDDHDTTEQLVVSVPMAAAEPSTIDTAVTAGAK